MYKKRTGLLLLSHARGLRKSKTVSSSPPRGLMGQKTRKYSRLPPMGKQGEGGGAFFLGWWWWFPRGGGGSRCWEMNKFPPTHCWGGGAERCYESNPRRRKIEIILVSGERQGGEGEDLPRKFPHRGFVSELVLWAFFFIFFVFFYTNAPPLRILIILFPPVWPENCRVLFIFSADATGGRWHLPKPHKNQESFPPFSRSLFFENPRLLNPFFSNLRFGEGVGWVGGDNVWMTYENNSGPTLSGFCLPTPPTLKRPAPPLISGAAFHIKRAPWELFAKKSDLMLKRGFSAGKRRAGVCFFSLWFLFFSCASGSLISDSFWAEFFLLVFPLYFLFFLV